MSKSVEKSGKTVQEAIDLALDELQVSEDDVTVEIIDEGSKALLKIFGGKDAKVRVTVNETPAMIASNFLKTVLDKMDVEATVTVTDEEDIIKVDIDGDNVGLLIGRRGETLDALQYLTNIISNKENDDYQKVVIDVGNYRGKRENTLEKLAERMADKVIKTRRNLTLEPMNPYERRIIHSALQNNKLVETYSVGEDPDRRVIVRLKK